MISLRPVLRGEALGKGIFTKSTEKVDPANAKPTDYDLFKGDPGQKDLLAAITQGKTVTLVIAESDPVVAVTWSAKAVTLDVKASAK